VVLDCSTRVKVAYEDNFTLVILYEGLDACLEETVEVGLEFDAMLVSGAVVGAVHVNKDEEAEIEDEGTTFAVELEAIERIWVMGLWKEAEGGGAWI
jgi:hypothetical protein